MKGPPARAFFFTQRRKGAETQRNTKGFSPRTHRTTLCTAVGLSCGCEKHTLRLCSFASLREHPRLCVKFRSPNRDFTTRLLD